MALVDAIEILGLLVLPVVLGGLGFYLVGGPEDAVPGVVVGGVVGFTLARVRREFHAHRTADGVERRTRPVPQDTLWARIAEVEYPEPYDRVLAVVLFGIGVGAFVAIPVVDPRNDPRMLWLVLAGVFGLTAGLATYASLRS